MITALSSKEVEVKQRPSVSQVWLAALPQMSHWHFKAKQKKKKCKFVMSFLKILNTCGLEIIHQEILNY